MFKTFDALRMIRFAAAIGAALTLAACSSDKAGDDLNGGAGKFGANGVSGGGAGLHRSCARCL